MLLTQSNPFYTVPCRNYYFFLKLLLPRIILLFIPWKFINGPISFKILLSYYSVESDSSLLIESFIIFYSWTNYLTNSMICFCFWNSIFSLSRIKFLKFLKCFILFVNSKHRNSKPYPNILGLDLINLN